MEKVPQYPALSQVELGDRFTVSISAKEGMQIPTVVTLPPKGGRTSPMPAIVFLHGGPFSHVSEQTDLRAHFLANCGYVVLQPNYRGSTGFGQKHQNAARRNWGADGVQKDITTVIEWAISEGYAKPDAIGVFGGSFGGFLALGRSTMKDSGVRCAASFFAPTCMVELLREKPTALAPSASLFRDYFGDPDDPAEVGETRLYSPRYFAPQVPILIYHGGEDTLVNPSHAADWLRGRNFPTSNSCPVTFLFNTAGGHGFADPAEESAVYTALAGFFSEHLGGKVSSSSAETQILLNTWQREGRSFLADPLPEN